MNVRPTYTRAQLDEAGAAWSTFPDEWQPWRELAASGPGILFPPDGSKHDSWDDVHPSQRAILIRAIRETSDLLRWAIRGAPEPSWARVIERLLAGRDEMREQLDLAPQPEKLDLTPSQSTYRLAEIRTIARDSAA